MDFRVLGPVGAFTDEGVALDIGPYQQRLVLAMCVLAVPRPVGPQRMIDALWEGDPPPGALNTVQAYVSKLRRVFEPGRTRNVPPTVLVSKPGGYVLDVPGGAIDLGRVRERLAEGRSLGAGGDHEGAVGQLRSALGEWSGEPLADLSGTSWAVEESAHLAELRLTIEEDLAEAELALGRGATLTGGLAHLIGAHPFRERLRVLAAHALYQAGRQADALGVLAEGRRLLMEDMGLDPDPRSREMERRILGQDPELRPRLVASTGQAVAVAEKAAKGEGAGLVGRDAEAEVLERAVAGAGHRVVLLAGEPGIGKTSLAEHAAEAARARDHRVVWGRCWSGSGAPPFWPWTQAVQDLVGRDGELARLAGAGLAGAGQAGAGQAGQFALYEAFARLLNEHGRVLVVLDDLQWADTSSLRLLEFLASTRLCPELTVVATYRDTDVRPGEPLEHTLGALLRLPHVRRLLLRGLAEEEIREYLGRAGADPDLAGEMDRLTAGNPFFLGEVLQLGETPEALSDVVRGRMAGLPPGTEEVLTVAALLGREAATDILTRVAELPEERVLDIVDAAVGARLLVEGDGPSCRFVHDIVRDVLREALPPLRRRKLHARIAGVLEERSGTRLTEIAHHYREGLLNSRMAGRAIGYTRRAAAQATAQFAHEDAVENLERAIGMIDRLPEPDDALRCDLLLDLAEAQAAAGMSAAAHVSLEAAAEIAERFGDDNRLARAVLGFSDPISSAMYEEMTGIARLAERIDRVLASDLAGDSPWRARLLAAAALTGSTVRPVERSAEMAEEAVRMARLTGDERTLSRTLIALQILLRSGHDHGRREAVAREIAEIGRRGGDLVVEWIGRENEYVELNASGDSGDTERAVELLAWLRETAERLRLPSMISLAAWQTAVHAYLSGRFDDALAAADASGAAHPEGALGRDDASLRREMFRFLALRAVDKGHGPARPHEGGEGHGADRSHGPGGAHEVGKDRDQGRAGEALALADAMLARRPGQKPWRVLRCLALIDLSRTAEARDTFAELSRDGFAEIGPELAYRFVPDAVSEVCAALGDEAAGRILYGRLAPHAGRLLGWSLTDLCLARLALLGGDEDRAKAHLRAAEAFAAGAGARVYEPAIRALGERLRSA
ncbi:BTAD domain-containing putative transcriptional regulator [Streptosporangium sp. NPDC049304]|uniref:BTAD domain-containing putative transcriptional regulator n=1 Tax=Streptosporangium sp. NPDC049304 TaxID=3154830 RepID=UPI00341858A1